MYINQLDDIVNANNNAYHKTIKMKAVVVKNSTYIDSSKNFNDKDPKFKVGNHVRISKYKKSFVKGDTPNWCEEVFVIKKVKNTVPCTYVINDLIGEEIIGRFFWKRTTKD